MLKLIRTNSDDIAFQNLVKATVLKELEKWAFPLNFSACLLETGKKQIGAIRLYEKCGYSVMPNFGQYKNEESSICFEKNLKLP